MLSPLDAMQSMGILIISLTPLGSQIDPRRQLLESLLGDRFPVYHQILLLGYSRFEFELRFSTFLPFCEMDLRDIVPSREQ